MGAKLRREGAAIKPEATLAYNLMQVAHLLRRSWIQTKTQNGVRCSDEANVAGTML